MPVDYLKQFREALARIGYKPERAGMYKNSSGVFGYYAIYLVGGKFYWYSVSDTTDDVPPSQVIDAISRGTVNRQGTYGRNGFEATIRFEDHSYMLGMGNDRAKERFIRMKVEFTA